MAKINFYLRDGKASKETPIILFLFYNRERTKIPTGKTIHPKYWNSLDQSVRTSKEFPQGKLINEFLRQAQEIVESTIFQLELELQRSPEKEELTAAIQHQLNPLDNSVRFVPPVSV
jgi:hypothetical protein